MKPLLFAICLPLIGCVTDTTYDKTGRVTSRHREPSPQFWTALGNGVAQFGAGAITAWAKQQEDQQRWERGEK